MRHHVSTTILVLSFLAAHAATASTVFRCTARNGQVTFSQQGCPSGSEMHQQQAINPTPGAGKATKMATPEKHERRKTRATERPDQETLTVVAERSDGCGNRLDASARRSAIIAQRILSGMTRADVESALGRPDSVASNNGSTRYRYVNGKGRSKTVNFDENGCVTGKR